MVGGLDERVEKIGRRFCLCSRQTLSIYPYLLPTCSMRLLSCGTDLREKSESRVFLRFSFCSSSSVNSSLRSTFTRLWTSILTLHI